MHNCYLQHASGSPVHMPGVHPYIQMAAVGRNAESHLARGVVIVVAQPAGTHCIANQEHGQAQRVGLADVGRMLAPLPLHTIPGPCCQRDAYIAHLAAV